MQFRSMIIANQEVSPGYFRMRVTAPPELAGAKPGQFVMVRVRDAIDPLLRRPFGIFDVGTVPSEYPGCSPATYLEMLYKVVGKGTEALATYHHGDHLDLLAPLGFGFDLGDPDEEKILVGGGIGIAPLYYLAKTLVARSRVRFIARFRALGSSGCVGSVALIFQVQFLVLPGECAGRSPPPGLPPGRGR